MKKVYLSILAAMMLITVGCGDSTAVDPNAPIANQPGAQGATKWSAQELAVTSKRCAGLGLYSNPQAEYTQWFAFCSCGYNGISAYVTYNQFASNARAYMNQWESQYKGVTGCLQSSGLSNSGAATQETLSSGVY